MLFSVLLKAESLLILSDVEFLSTTVNYFKSIADFAIPTKNQQTDLQSDLEETLTAGSAALLAPTTTLELDKKEDTAKKSKPLPKMKVEANIKEFRIAVIEAVDEPQPQALTLKVYCHNELT